MPGFPSKKVTTKTVTPKAVVEKGPKVKTTEIKDGRVYIYLDGVLIQSYEQGRRG